MAEQFQEDKGEMAVLKRRGFPIYETNPSVGNFPVRIKRSDVKAGQSVYMVAQGSGDVIGRGAFGFVEEKEVDIDWTYSGNKLHPTQKPVSVLLPLVETFSPAQGTVLDPFAGSGSTGGKDARARLHRY